MKKILIIEDDANTLYSLQAKLSLNGFKVDSDLGNTNKESLLNKIRTSNPDFIVLDLLLSKINSLHLLKSIKTDINLKHIEIFSYSNISDNNSKNKAINYGADHFLSKKEMSIDETVDKIAKIIKNKAI